MSKTQLFFLFLVYSIHFNYKKNKTDFYYELYLVDNLAKKPFKI